MLGIGELYLWNVFVRVVEFVMMSVALSMVMGCVEWDPYLVNWCRIVGWLTRMRSRAVVSLMAR